MVPHFEAGLPLDDDDDTVHGMHTFTGMHLVLSLAVKWTLKLGSSMILTEL